MWLATPTPQNGSCVIGTELLLCGVAASAMWEQAEQACPVRDDAVGGRASARQLETRTGIRPPSPCTVRDAPSTSPPRRATGPCTACWHGLPSRPALTGTTTSRGATRTDPSSRVGNSELRTFWHRDLALAVFILNVSALLRVLCQSTACAARDARAPSAHAQLVCACTLMSQRTLVVVGVVMSCYCDVMVTQCYGVLKSAMAMP